MVSKRCYMRRLSNRYQPAGTDSTTESQRLLKYGCRTEMWDIDSGCRPRSVWRASQEKWRARRILLRSVHGEWRPLGGIKDCARKGTRAMLSSCRCSWKTHHIRVARFLFNFVGQVGNLPADANRPVPELYRNIQHADLTIGGTFPTCPTTDPR